MLRGSFGEKRVKRSPHPFAATAIGLAVFLDKEAGFALSERLSRHFGVFREAHTGEDIFFDPILPKDAPLPTDGQPPLVVTRTYRAAHNIGHFRFVECSRLLDGRPDGDVTPYDPVFFPFDPNLHDEEDLARRPVGRRRGRAGCRGALRRHPRRRGGGDPHNAAGRLHTELPAGATRPVSRSSVGDIASRHPDLSPRAPVG